MQDLTSSETEMHCMDPERLLSEKSGALMELWKVQGLKLCAMALEKDCAALNPIMR